MLNKPINLRILLTVAIWEAVFYVMIVGVVNFKLFYDLLATQPVGLEALRTAFARCDGCLGTWLGSTFAICFIGAACMSGGSYASSTASSPDDEHDFGSDSPWRYSSDDDFRINPASGLPMLGATDAAGNCYGCSHSQGN